MKHGRREYIKLLSLTKATWRYLAWPDLHSKVTSRLGAAA